MFPSLDRTDLVILNIIQREPRMPHKDISKRVGKSCSVIFERIRRLCHEGFIRRFVAILDHNMINKGMVVFAHIKLKEHSNKALLKFGRNIAELDEVMEAYHMAGQYDFLLRVAVADMQDYNQFIMKRLSAFTEIESINSRFVMKEVKHETSYALTDTFDA